MYRKQQTTTNLFLIDFLHPLTLLATHAVHFRAALVQFLQLVIDRLVHIVKLLLHLKVDHPQLILHRLLYNHLQLVLAIKSVDVNLKMSNLQRVFLSLKCNKLFVFFLELKWSPKLITKPRISGVSLKFQSNLF